MPFIIAYDICHPRRLARVARRLEKRALRLQKSVFWFDGSCEEARRVLDSAAEAIDWESDCIQAWMLHSQESAQGQVRGVNIPLEPAAAVLGEASPRLVAERRRSPRKKTGTRHSP
ncbi:hypothetical protein [Thermopirellula anaerolimosa]